MRFLVALTLVCGLLVRRPAQERVPPTDHRFAAAAAARLAPPPPSPSQA
jgi:hypothetical protein